MGFAPDQVDKMTLWQFMACEDAYIDAYGTRKGGGDGAEMDEDDLRALGVEGF